jgi:hypothetical protein
MNNNNQLRKNVTRSDRKSYEPNTHKQGFANARQMSVGRMRFRNELQSNNYPKRSNMLGLTRNLIRHTMTSDELTELAERWTATNRWPTYPESESESELEWESESESESESETESEIDRRNRHRDIMVDLMTELASSRYREGGVESEGLSMSIDGQIQTGWNSDSDPFAMEMRRHVARAEKSSQMDSLLYIDAPPSQETLLGSVHCRELDRQYWFDTAQRERLMDFFFPASQYKTSRGEIASFMRNLSYAQSDQLERFLNLHEHNPAEESRYPSRCHRHFQEARIALLSGLSFSRYQEEQTVSESIQFEWDADSDSELHRLYVLHVARVEYVDRFFDAQLFARTEPEPILAYVDTHFVFDTARRDLVMDAFFPASRAISPGEISTFVKSLSNSQIKRLDQFLKFRIFVPDVDLGF